MSHGYCGTCLRINLWIANKMDILSQYAGGTAPYEALQDFTLRGDTVAAGDTVQMSTAQAAMFIKAGLIKDPSKAKASAPAAAATEAKK
jgi:hypothetical protein